tara:strand:+ start:405 stop:2534 length:2130 start_codon:yes stop_codon:yes gene_type:complete
MKKAAFIISILVSFYSLGQKKSDKTDMDLNYDIQWAEYFFENKDFAKVVERLSNIEDSLFPNTVRIYSKSLKNIKRIEEAAKVLDPLVQSDYANVADYYDYISLIPENKKLVREYIEKAKRIPLNDNTDFKTRINSKNYEVLNLNLNTQKSEFGAFMIDPDKGSIFYLGNQKYIRKKIKSINQIYNLYKTEIDTSTFKTKSANELNIRFNSIYQDGPISLNPVTKMLYLTRTTNKVRKIKNIQLAIFQIPYDKFGKELPKLLELNFDDYSSIHPTISADGKVLYFSSDRPGGYGGMDLYYVNIEDDKIAGEITNMGPDINTEKDEVFPFIFSDKYLFYSSNKGSSQKFNIYLATNKIYNRWENNILSKPFNSEYDDTSFSIDIKTKTGFISSNRKGGKGDDDIYAFKFIPKIEGEEDSYNFFGTDTLVVGSNNVLKNDIEKMKKNDPLAQLIPLKITIVNDVTNGKLNLNPNGTFWYNPNSNEFKKDSFSYRIISDFSKSKEIKVTLENKNFQKLINYENLLKPIYFDFDKYVLKDKFIPRLDSIAQILNNNPNLKIEISSFTDCQGKRTYNQKLSERRTKTVSNYIKTRLNVKTVIEEKAFGESKVEGSSVNKFTIAVGLFSNKTSADNFARDKSLDPRSVEIIKVNIYYQVNLGIFDTYEKATEKLTEVQKSISNAEIKKIKCSKRPEYFHSLNRKTTFKIIEKNSK